MLYVVRRRLFLSPVSGTATDPFHFGDPKKPRCNADKVTSRPQTRTPEDVATVLLRKGAAVWVFLACIPFS
jgi:hypothetical protein